MLDFSGVSANCFAAFAFQEDEEMLSRISSQTRGLAAVRGKLYVYVTLQFSCFRFKFSVFLSAIVFVKVLC